jgi:glycosyltransferase involved in cell wall biosynthesis
MTSTKPAETGSPFFSIIIPVYNGGTAFQACLHAIALSQFQDWELIVVDDSSTDDSGERAIASGATVIKTNERLGPGAARNLGAATAKGSYLCFIDADCEVHPDTFLQLAMALQQDPTIDAVFGSYDDAPKATNFVAQFKNLLHHYVHQTGCEDASTFWSGCGAVKRSTFLKLNGFDVCRYDRPCIEDIELGYRIRQAGGHIRLVKQAQVKHYKAWTLWGLIKTDICDRGIPWTILIKSNPSACVNDLNLKTSSRMSVVLSYLLVLFTVASVYRIDWLMGALVCAIVLVKLNWDVYQFFYRKHGFIFAVQSVLMHWLYFLYGGLAFILGTIMFWLERAKPTSRNCYVKSPVR